MDAWLERAGRRRSGTLGVLPLALWLFAPQTGSGADARLLIPVVWGAALALALLQRGDPAGATARISRYWQRLDPLLAAGLLWLTLFRLPPSSPAWLGVPLALALLLAGLQRLPGPGLVALASAVLVFGVALPRVFSALVVSRIAASHDLTIDHRMLPDGGEINGDGARFRGKPEELADDDFVVLFLGDSFTFGFNLTYAQAYPYQFEELARGAGCSSRVRAVDFGWTSSSPLLALRLLREVGYRYRPDLVVYNLDMTDFHDDLRYERALREAGDFTPDAGRVARELLLRRLPWAQPLEGGLSRLAAELRTGAAPETAGPELPADRFFATAQPLAQSRAGIEAGVMKNLSALDSFTRSVLHAPFALVVYPRAYQYSKRESPDNWEDRRTERLGPWVREPFRYFEEEAPRLPYPVFSLLPAFERSEVFPLFARSDPHWNANGARLAAEATLKALREKDLVPCEGATGPP